MPALVGEYAMSINSQNRSMRAVTTSIFDAAKRNQQQQQQQRTYSSVMPTYLNRFDN